MPWHLSNLTRAYGEIGQLDEAWRCIACYGETETCTEPLRELGFRPPIETFYRLTRLVQIAGRLPEESSWSAG